MENKLKGRKIGGPINITFLAGSGGVEFCCSHCGGGGGGGDDYIYDDADADNGPWSRVCFSVDVGEEKVNMDVIMCKKCLDAMWQRLETQGKWNALGVAQTILC